MGVIRRGTRGTRGGHGGGGTGGGNGVTWGSTGGHRVARGITGGGEGTGLTPRKIGKTVENKKSSILPYNCPQLAKIFVNNLFIY